MGKRAVVEPPLSKGGKADYRDGLVEKKCCIMIEGEVHPLPQDLALPNNKYGVEGIFRLSLHQETDGTVRFSS